MKITKDADLTSMGFESVGALNDRTWCWYNEAINVMVVTLDCGNGFCNFCKSFILDIKEEK